MRSCLTRLIQIAFFAGFLHAQSCLNQIVPQKPALTCRGAERLTSLCECGPGGANCHWEWACTPGNRGARTTTPPLPSIPDSPQKVFLSTDACGDIDDAQAVSVLIWLHQHRYIQILGINWDMQSSTGFPGNGGWADGASFINAMLLRSGLNGPIPLGACPWGGATGCNWGGGDNYCLSTVTALGSPRLKLSAVKDSVALLRSVINSNPPGTVRLISVGPTLNVARFMQSPANYNSDGIPRTGAQLWAMLQDYVPMGGQLKPSGGFENNYAYENGSTPQGTSISYILNNSAGIPIYGVDANVGAMSGGRAYYSLPTDSPLQVALTRYRAVAPGNFTLPPPPYTAFGFGRPAWDPSTVLFASIGTRDPGDGNGPYYGLSASGTITVTVAPETSSFSTAVPSGHFVVNVLRPKDTQAILEQLQQDDILPVPSRAPSDH
jgi:hypothetical protein